jgi:hypothetical protein
MNLKSFEVLVLSIYYLSKKILLSLTYVFIFPPPLLTLLIAFLNLIPLQHHTFYDLIVSKARGKSGPLFHFDVHEDIRLLHDATVEKDEVLNNK